MLGFIVVINFKTKKYFLIMETFSFSHTVITHWDTVWESQEKTEAGAM